MQGFALDLPVRPRAAGEGIEIHGAAHLGNAAFRVLHAAVAPNDIGALEANLVAGEHPLILLHGDLHEVLPLDIDLPGELNFPGAHLRMIRVVFQRHLPGFALRPVGQDDLQGVQHRHGPGSRFPQIVPDAVLQDGEIHHGIRLAHADDVNEIPDGAGGIAAAAHGGQGRHPGIVPPGDVAPFHQLAEVALAHDRPGHIQAGKLQLPGPGREHMGALFHDPVVERPVDFVFQGAHGMADAFQRVPDGMGEIVHRIDAPFIAGPPVLLIQNPVHGGIPHDDIRGGHIDLRPQGLAALRELAVFHPAEQIQAFLGGPVPPGAVAPGLRQRSPVFPHLVLAQLVHIGQAAADPVLRDLIALVIIIGSVEFPAGPVEAQPVDVPLNGFHILRILLGGIGIVKAEVAFSAVFFRGQKVHDQSLAVTDMHISVRLRGKAGMNLRIPSFRQIPVDGVPDKIAAGCFFHHRFVILSRSP